MVRRSIAGSPIPLSKDPRRTDCRRSCGPPEDPALNSNALGWVVLPSLLAIVDNEAAGGALGETIIDPHLAANAVYFVGHGAVGIDPFRNDDVLIRFERDALFL